MNIVMYPWRGQLVHHIYSESIENTKQGPLLLIWINFIPNKDK